MLGLAFKGLVGSAGALIAALAIGAGAANAYPTLGVCYYDAATEMSTCTFSNPDGIKSVFITEDTEKGLVVQVNETYDCETPVTVQWKDLGPVHHFEVESCPPDPAVPDPDDLPIGVEREPPEPPRPIDDLKAPDRNKEPIIVLKPIFSF